MIEALCRMFPQADIFTHVVDENILSETLKKHTIKTTFIDKLPFSKKLYQSYLPLMPRALEEVDLSGYDLVISSESGPAKGVIVPPDAVHLCYCHSPMRYLWDQYHVYKSGAGVVGKLAMPIFASGLRQWDVTSAARVDGFIANSAHVANRIRKYWRRNADVIFPPVAVEDFSPVKSDQVEDYYLWVGELVGYKKPDLMVEAFNKSGKKLVVVGGPDKTRKRLKKSANSNIRFLGKVDFDTMKHHMARCKALIFPGEEDFGIVPVEVMASGRPVIAYGRGGAQDTVIDGKTGVLFKEQSASGLNAAIDRFENEVLDKINGATLVAHASKFSEGAFRHSFAQLLKNHDIEIDIESVANKLAVAS